ncbi:MAG: DNA translocase FtsK 4TM domain-containing protein, partial [Candidatus Aureabacteria bacterium]|nr:DNA translocase FtsK 4TM domain-containing protein [Candidatus Auribacterota bacterium]
METIIQKEKQTKPRHEMAALLILFFLIFQVLSYYSYNPYDLSYHSTHPNNPCVNHGGIIGAYLTFIFLFTYGLAYCIAPFFILSLIIRLFLGLSFIDFLKWLLFLNLSMISASIVLSVNTYPGLDAAVFRYQLVSAGGIVGTVLGQEVILQFLGKSGGFVISLLLFLISLQGIGRFSYLQVIKRVYQTFVYVFSIVKKSLFRILSSIREYHAKRQKRKKEKEAEQKIISASEPPPYQGTFNPDWGPKQAEEKETSPLPEKNSESREDLSGSRSVRKKKGDWAFPGLDLLKPPQEVNLDLEENIKANAEKLIQTLHEFEVEADVVGVETGPVITRYEIQIGSGIKVQKVTSLDNDLALAMRAKSVRIIAPIPGKAAIGIEIPNQIRRMVYFKELLNSDAFKKMKHTIPLILGKDISGKPVFADLVSMPHLLIAGATGSGKSVCINSIIMSLLYTLSPAEVKIMMVDPKKVEMTGYKNLPHLYVPLITNPNKVAIGLRCLIEEMENRYHLFKEVEVRNIESYNKKDKTPYRKKMKSGPGDNGEPLKILPEKLPYIVVLIDELADLMMIARSEVESSIVRLAQLSRAVGIHLILATQRPSVDVVTGLIKANVPGRIAFRVSAKVDSRTVLDTIGAEKLLGYGDMLFLSPQSSDIVRIQGAYLDDDEIRKAVEYWESQGEPEYDPVTLNALEGPSDFEGEEDPLFKEAVEFIRETQQASTSLLQRKFKIGYNRASRLME